MNLTNLIEKDNQVIWHPYSQHGLNPLILPVKSAQGAYLHLEGGGKILDAISSWWVNIHGHSHPALCRALTRQAETLEHVIFAGFTHQPAVELAETLIQYEPLQKAGMRKAFYSDNGSTAVEVALKMAFQYFQNRGIEGRDRFLALNHSYHGDTLGAMAVGEPSGFHTQFRKLMPPVDFVEPGNCDALKEILQQRGHSYAAFIFEPLVQGASGMKMYDKEYLEEALRLCKEYGVLTICDEIFTGFYRTGRCFAFEHVSAAAPDFICVSKGLTGGFLPLAITLTTEDVFTAFVSQDVKNAFLHGHSYTANPLACAVALESWRLLHTEECQTRIRAISEITQKRVDQLRSHPQVKSTRSLGTIGAVELKSDLTYFSPRPGYFQRKALEKGVLIRPLGNVFYAVPPYCCTDQEIHQMYDTIFELIEGTN